MAWIKVPPEHHPIFLAAVPKDRRVRTMQMFGGIAATVNGNIFGGLFARSAIVKLGDDDRAAALALDGAGPFDPMGNGRVSKDMIMLPEDVMDQPAELRSWLDRALAYVATKPPKVPKPAAKPSVAKPIAKKPIAKKPVAKKPVAKAKAKRAR